MEPVSMTLFGVIHFAIWLVCLFSILASNRTPGMKILWLVVVLLLPCIGVILYFIFGRSAP